MVYRNCFSENICNKNYMIDKINNSQNRFINVKEESIIYKYLKSKYSGKYKIPSYQAVNKAKNKCFSLNEDEYPLDLGYYEYIM